LVGTQLADACKQFTANDVLRATVGTQVSAVQCECMDMMVCGGVSCGGDVVWLYVPGLDDMVFKLSRFDGSNTEDFWLNPRHHQQQSPTTRPITTHQTNTLTQPGELHSTHSSSMQVP
jgi:hypothetical protein